MLSPIGCQFSEEVENMTEKEKKIFQDEKFKKRMEGRKGPPAWAKAIAGWGWSKKISPFSVARLFGRRQSLKAIGRYVENRQKVDNEE